MHLQSLRTNVFLEEFKNCDFFSSQSTDSCQPVPARINDFFTERAWHFALDIHGPCSYSLFSNEIRPRTSMNHPNEFRFRQGALNEHGRIRHVLARLFLHCSFRKCRCFNLNGWWNSLRYHSFWSKRLIPGTRELWRSMSEEVKRAYKAFSFSTRLRTIMNLVIKMSIRSHK